jgi:NitT/TauT family transport system permease protein
LKIWRLAGLLALLLLWSVGVRLGGEPRLLPTPTETLRALAEIAWNGQLWKHVVASLFRVSWGYGLAVLVGVPLGLALGLRRRLEQAVAPLLELLRPISPLAWTPIAILWLGVGDLAAVAIIAVASVTPLALAIRGAVRGMLPTHLRAGANFGLGPVALGRRVVLPAIAPQVLGGLRLALGIAWLVVVAAEMLAVNSGLGFLIVDARNAGNRYDLVVAGMVMIGAVGLGLDAVLRRCERLPAVVAAAGGAP